MSTTVLSSNLSRVWSVIWMATTREGLYVGFLQSLLYVCHIGSKTLRFLSFIHF